MNPSSILVASDHAGFSIKEFVIELLKEQGHRVDDLGPGDDSRVDYPDFADKLCKRMYDQSMGVLICGSGQGMAMRANKYPNIRAALCNTPELATLSREHNNANTLCLGARVTDHETVKEILQKFFSTSFSEGRHAQRVEKINHPV